MRIIRRNKDPMEISEAELARLTADMDQLHHDQAYPAMREATAEWAEVNHDSAMADEDRKARYTSRRSFLLGAGATVVGGLALAACSSGSSSGSGSSTTTSGGGQLSGDLQMIAVNASLENLAVGTYMSGIQAAQANKLGTVPPAVPTFATTAMNQHMAHAQAFNGLLQQAGKKPVTAPDPALQPMVNSDFAKVTDVTGLAQLALQLEMVAAETYQNEQGAFSSQSAIKTTASIQPVEMQHAAILSFVLGQYPVPDSFSKTDMARPPSDYQGG